LVHAPGKKCRADRTNSAIFNNSPLTLSSDNWGDPSSRKRRTPSD
jgi:hypothetical protein